MSKASNDITGENGCGAECDREIFMIDFLNWLIEPANRNTNIFTLLTVVLSGLISWFISAKYFTKGNRENLRVSLLYPMKRIIEESYSWKNYQKLVCI